MSDRDTWPCLRVRVELLPWHWRIVPRLYRDDVRWWELMKAEWLFLEIEWMCNTPLFGEPGKQP